MEPAQSSQSIIYMSPNNSRFHSNESGAPFIFEEAAVPPLFGHDFEACQPDLRTPQKHPPSSAKRNLNENSSGKPLPPFPDLYDRFQNEPMQASISSKSKEKGVRIYDLRTPSKEGTVQKEKKYEELLMSSRRRQIRKPLRTLEPKTKSFKQQYLSLMGKIERKQPFEIPDVFFFKPETLASLTKLVCFDINSKNGKYVRFDHFANTCLPYFPCHGCRKIFPEAAALGGHLSRCLKREEHLHKLQDSEELEISEDEWLQFQQEYLQGVEPIQEDNEKSEYLGEVKLEEGEYKRPIRKNKTEREEKSSSEEKRKRSMLENSRLKRPENYTRIHLPVDPRYPIPRAAKFRASQMIHEVIRGPSNP